jgi:hypothetical protein
MSIKDKWEKLDIFTKFFNGVILAVLILIVKIGSEKITYSLQYGAMVQKTITDLSNTSSDNKVRRDLSLITLNRTIGDQQPKLIAELSEIIYINDTIKNNERNTAFKIMKERDPERALYYENKIMDEINETRTDVLYNDSELTTDSLNSSNENKSCEKTFKSPSINKALSILKDKIKISIDNIVYIQVAENNNSITSISEELKNNGYKVPSVEIVNGNFHNCVKYFNAIDAIKAHEITNIIERKLNIKIKIIKVDNENANIPDGQIEVWINNK